MLLRVIVCWSDSVCVGGPHLALWVRLDLPASRQLQLQVCELVNEEHQVAIVLVALKVPGVTPHLQDHVLDTAAAGEHAVGSLQRAPTV